MRTILLTVMLLGMSMAGCISENVDSDDTEAEFQGEAYADFYNASHAVKPEVRWEPVWTFVTVVDDQMVGTDGETVTVEAGADIEFQWDISDLGDYEYPTNFIDYTLTYERLPDPITDGSGEELPGQGFITLHKVGFHNFTLNYQDGQGLNVTQQIIIQIGEPCSQDSYQWNCPNFGVDPNAVVEEEEDAGGNALTGVEQTFAGTWDADNGSCVGGTGWSEGATGYYSSNFINADTWGQTYHAEFSKNAAGDHVKFRNAAGEEIETHTSMYWDAFEGEHPVTGTPADAKDPVLGAGTDQRGTTISYAFQDQNTITATIPGGAVQVYFYSCGGKGFEQTVEYNTPAWDIGQSYPRLSEGYVTESCEQCGAGGANTGVGYRASVERLEQVFLEIVEEDWGQPFAARTTDNHIGLVFRDNCDAGGAGVLYQPEDLVTTIYGEIPNGARCALMWDQALWTGAEAPDGDGGGNTRVTTAGAKLSMLIGSEDVSLMDEDGLCFSNPVSQAIIPVLGGLVYADGTWIYAEHNGIPGLQLSSEGSLLDEQHVKDCQNGDLLVF